MKALKKQEANSKKFKVLREKRDRQLIKEAQEKVKLIDYDKK